MSKKRPGADHRADVRGGRWVGIPLTVIESAAYRDLSVHARALLIELTARMNGYNNGSIAMSQRELWTALGCSPRKVVSATVELVTHGFVDVPPDAHWKQRAARLFRLTFVNTATKGGSHVAATNDYLRWTPSEQNLALPTRYQQGANLLPRRKQQGEALLPTRYQDDQPHNAKPPFLMKSAATDVVALICKPYPQAESGEQGPLSPPLFQNGPIGAFCARECEHCREPFTSARRVKRFCSERCRKAAEAKRHYERANAA